MFYWQSNLYITNFKKCKVLKLMYKEISEFIKSTLEIFFPVLTLHYRAYKILIKDQNSYLYLTGWMQSVKERKPLDGNGNPIPWMNFAVVKLLEDRLQYDFNLFEYGSGYSTYFYANKVRSVTSVEYDKKWFDIIKPQLPENVLLIFKNKDVDGDYCRVIGSTKEQYDVVIVDGRDRVNCVKQSIAALSPKGIVVLDDSQRARYLEGIEFAERNGFSALNIEGLKATDGGVDRSTILYRRDNILNI
jgi:hypothetical protein